MWSFLTKFCPTSISTMAGVTFEDPLPLFVYPWSRSDTSKKTQETQGSVVLPLIVLWRMNFAVPISLYED